MPRFDGTSADFRSALDFVINVFQEKIPGKGEDSILYSFSRFGGIVGAFDGCGGSGAKKYEKYGGRTGAYMASRVVCGAVKDWFCDYLKAGEDTADASVLKSRIKSYLNCCRETGGSTTTMKGSLSKDFPTTAAVILTTIACGLLRVTCMWAGDSRCYLMDSDGLKQLTEDDLGGLDAMENLTADGVLTNVITASRDFTIHQKTITLSKPCILFAATDGCFGYLSTPMEFEYLLLSTLLSADSVAAWENGLTSTLREIAGDDFTLSGMSFGFGSFLALKKSFYSRYTQLLENYISGIMDKSREEKIAMWNEYKVAYAKYLREG